MWGIWPRLYSSQEGTLLKITTTALFEKVHAVIGLLFLRSGVQVVLIFNFLTGTETETNIMPLRKGQREGETQKGRRE